MPLSLLAIPATWTPEMDAIVGPHLGTAFPGTPPPVGGALPPYDWREIADDANGCIGFLWFNPDGTTCETTCEISIVVSPEHQMSGVGATVLEMAESEAKAAHGATTCIGIVREDNPISEKVASFLTRHGYALQAGLTFSPALLSATGKLTFEKRVCECLPSKETNPSDVGGSRCP